MAHEIQPSLTPTLLTDLRPTQMTVGLAEVRNKAAGFAAKKGDAGALWLGRHLLPVVIGPKERIYLIDHHHLARALLEVGQKEALTLVHADLRNLSKEGFWTYMDMRSWVCPYDAEGLRQPFDSLPKTIADLADDPWRALAGDLRLAGGYAKDPTPFSEFLWADYLRRLNCTSLEEALVLSSQIEASYLPGWCGKKRQK